MDEKTKRVQQERRVEEQLRASNRQSRQIEEQLARNRQSLMKLEKDEQRFADSYQRQVNALEELSQRWKTRDGLSFMTECLQDENRFHRQIRQFLGESRRQLEQENRKLFNQQETIVRERRQLSSGERRR
ncbi:DUF3958 family protein [Lactovum odontotermitis]